MPRARSKAATLGGSSDETESAFYEALQRGDIDLLMSCWADDDEIVCVHPGGPRLLGPAAIRAAFEAMFSHGTVRARPAQVHRAVALSSAVHSVVELQDLAVATSGDYRHYLQVGDARLAHTMDTRRGAPVRNEVASVTVLARQCMHADAWATALLVAGPGEGLALAQRMGLEVLWMLRRGNGLVTLGLGRFGSGAPASGV